MPQIDWTIPKAIVEDTFFYDSIDVYEVTDGTKDDMGERTPGEQVVATAVKCNIQSQGQSKESAQTGESYLRTLRISLPKDAFSISTSKQYKVKVLLTRLHEDITSPWWRVTSIQEGQLSIVLTCVNGPAV